MAKRLVESLNGIGAVHAGGVLLRTTAYSLSVWADGASVVDPAGTSIDGHLDITGIAEAVVLAGPETLTLTLEDGRRLAFRLTSSGGSIVGRGWVDAS
jgi:hypothetical protein